MKKGVPSRTLRCVAISYLLLISTLICSADPLGSWTNVATSPFGSFNKVIYGNGVFAAISSLKSNYDPSITNYSGISCSTDGSTWTHIPTGNAQLNSLAFGNGIFTAVGWDAAATTNGFFMYSTNGIDWSTPQANTPRMQRVTFGNGIFLAVGYDSISGQGWIGTSTDGKSWPRSQLSTTNALFGVAYGNGLFVAVGAPYVATGKAKTAIVLTSTNGTNWATPSPLPFTGGLYTVNFVNGSFYAEQITNDSSSLPVTIAFASTNGTNWTKLTNSYPYQWVSSLSTNGLYFYESYANGNIYVSKDATNWVTHPSGIAGGLSDLVYGPDFFVAVTDHAAPPNAGNGSIYRSAPTLPVLSSKRQSDGTVLITLVEGNILPRTYSIQSSTDLSHWTNRVTFTNTTGTTIYMVLTPTNSAPLFYRSFSP